MSSGTSSTGTDFTAEEICRIIKTCSNKNIARIKAGSLEIDFRMGPAEVYLDQVVEGGLLVPPKSGGTRKRYKMSENGEIIVEEIEELDNKERRAELLDMEVERMMLEDPISHEDLMCDQLLNEGQGIKASYGIEDT